MTFIEAAKHITNYSVGHESRSHLTGSERLAYPAHHIEADNRLSWLLGRLDRVYGNEPLYVHLTRNPEDVAQSFLRRANRGILLAYRTQILMRAERLSPDTPLLDYCRDYVATVTENITHFLHDKPRTMSFRLETAQADFKRFWDEIGAEGDLTAALAEWDVRHNDSTSQPTHQAVGLNSGK